MPECGVHLSKLLELIALGQPTRSQHRSRKHAAEVAVRNLGPGRPAPAPAFHGSEIRSHRLSSQVEAPQQRRGPLKRVSDIPVLIAQVGKQSIAKFWIRFERT